MKIASNGAIPKSFVARADAHCFLFRPCAIPSVCLVDAARPHRVGARYPTRPFVSSMPARRGPEARATMETLRIEDRSAGERWSPVNPTET